MPSGAAVSLSGWAQDRRPDRVVLLANHCLSGVGGTTVGSASGVKRYES